MIGTVRKHQTWLWAVIITVIIISFVIFFSPQAGLDMGRRDYDFGTIRGRSITREEFINAQKDAMLFYRLSMRDWGTPEDMRNRGYDLEREAYSRLLFVEKLKEMDVQVSTDATVDLVRQIFGATSGKPFPMDEYNGFIRDLESRGFTKNDFDRFVRHEVGRQHLVSVFGLSGKLIPPAEAEEIYKRENQTIKAEAVFFTASNYLAQVSVNETNLSNFFVQNMARYRTPEKLQISYVKFDASNYAAEAQEQLAKMTNAPAAAEDYYMRRGGTNYYKDAQGKGLTFEEARSKVDEDILKQLALQSASKPASELISDLYNYAEANKSDKTALAKVAAKKNLKVEQTAPFDPITGPTNLTTSVSFRRAVFNLSEDEPYNKEPIDTDDALFVVWLDKRFPSEAPSLASVREKVVQDYKMTEAQKLARQAGDKFAETVALALQDGKKFDAIVAQEKLKSTSLPPFSPSTRSLPELKGLPLENLQNAAFRIQPGKASDFMATQEGGVVVYIESKTPPPAAKITSDMPEFINQIREQRQYTAYGHWLTMLQQELQLKLPVMEEQKKS